MNERRLCDCGQLSASLEVCGVDTFWGPGLLGGSDESCGDVPLEKA